MRCFWSGLVLASILAAGGAGANPAVYHSPNDDGWRPPQLASGNNPYLWHVRGASNVSLNLWFDPGPNPISGTVCVDATGDASCAYDVRVEAKSGPQLTGFTPTAPSEVVFNLTSAELRVNRMPAMPIVGPQKIGVLTMSSGPRYGQIRVTGVHSVGAKRQLLAIDGLPPPPPAPPPNPPGVQIVAVPEPDMLILLLSGLAGLAALHRLRASR
jgi:hypothetical protein